jgi:hypothetical protein
MTSTSHLSKDAMSADERVREHLDPGVLAAFIDGALPPAERALAESHLADCEACRADVIAAVRLTRRDPVRRWYAPAAAVAAAAAILFMVVGRAPAPVGIPEPVTREPVITTTVAPVTVAPRGKVDRAAALVWTSVPYADLYRLTIFDDAGRVIYESQTRDTSAAIPASIHLRPRTSYFWKLEAQTGWNRWVPSELTEFSVDPTRR